MRLRPLTALFALTVLSFASAAPTLEGGRVEIPEAELLQPRAAAPEKAADDTVLPASEKNKPTTDGGSNKGTKFNGAEVPPMRELSGETLDEDIANGYWYGPGLLVEFFSPYCHHCKAFAPTWQTLYEFYYTSNPLPSRDSPDSQSSLNSFSRYYNFKIAKIDCFAFGTACANHDIHSFPTIVLLKDGKEVKRNVGAKDLAFMSSWIEETLETIRPGSRSKDGVKLPKVGADHVEGAEPAAPATKDKYFPAGPPIGNEVATTSTSSASTKTTLRATKVAPPRKETPNHAGKSVPLTAENFQRLVTTTHDPWFVKFYAPWCHHCQAMAPNWQGMARDMQGRLNIGEVNCDVEKRLCKDVRVKGYPTLLFFRGGERIEYDGLRGLGDLISFANKAVAVGDGVIDVDAAGFQALEKTEEVIFLYFYDHATTSEDLQALERLVLSLIGHAKLAKTSDPVLANRFKISTWPRLL
ncbi:hypothetical protein LTR28_012441, partial [Elasticomyces elasticus]